MFKKLCYIFIFVFHGLFSIYLYAVDTVSLGTYKFFSEKDFFFEAALRNSAKLVILLLAVMIMFFIDHVLSESVNAFCSFRLRKDHKIGMLGLYRLIILLSVASILLFVNINASDDYSRQEKIAKMRDFLVNERFVIHAGGSIDGDSYTNSKEAIENCYIQGNRVAEIDILETYDGALVLAHDEDSDDIWATGIDSDEPLTLDEFMEKKVYGKYTTMSMDNMAEFMREHTDFYIVTDVKDDNIQCCTKISEDYPDLLERIIVQIYHEGEYDRIRSLGFPYIIYSLYRADDDEIGVNVLKSVAIKDELVGYTFWADWAEYDFMEGMLETGTPLFVHTLNDRVEIREALDKGISGIYTDLTDVEAYRKI